jgi:nucleolar protein 56
MEIFIAKNILGVFTLDEKGTVIDYFAFPRDPREIVTMVRGDYEKELAKKFEKTEIMDGGRLLRKYHRKILDKVGISPGEYYSLLREVSLELAKIEMQMVPEDQMIINGIKALEDLEESLNTLSERLREWYSPHFPELNKKIDDHEKFLKLVKEYGHRKDFTGELAELARNSIGGEMGREGIEMLREFAGSILNLWDLKRQLEGYLSDEMGRVAPNVSSLLGPILGARMISLAKGLENLAKMPGSRVQVLGAEKALFKHIRGGASSPKHGALFQHPLLKSSPKWQRGKIARILAQKVSIAARADIFSREYIAGELKADLEKRVQEIKEKFKEEPKRYKPLKRRHKKRRR